MNRSGQSKRRIMVVDSGTRKRKTDVVVIEEPLEIRLRAGDQEHTVAITMRTPGHDYELAAGFLYNEGLITGKDDIASMVYCVDDAVERQEYNTLSVKLNAVHLPELHQLDRYFFTNSACGVCGRTMLDELEKRQLPSLSEGPVVDPEVVTTLPAALRHGQDLFERTGGLHAAALFTADGRLLAVREDVGRHNALDKLTGWGLMNHELPFHDRIVLVSGRASYELLHKCCIVGAPILCAVSAPSSLAVDVANRFGITLIAFLRGRRFNLYTHPGRIAAQPRNSPASNQHGTPDRSVSRP